MHRRLTLFTVLFLAAPAALADPSDTQIAQALLTEIRQLRQDLQATAATVQRVQIVMYRLQAQAVQVEHATQRLDNARAQCTQAQRMQKTLAAQIENAEKQEREAENPVERKNAERVLSILRSSAQESVDQEQHCQGEQADADSQFRAEQARRSDLQDQLERLDTLLAAYGKK